MAQPGLAWPASSTLVLIYTSLCYRLILHGPHPDTSQMYKTRVCCALNLPSPSPNLTPEPAHTCAKECNRPTWLSLSPASAVAKHDSPTSSSDRPALSNRSHMCHVCSAQLDMASPSPSTKQVILSLAQMVHNHYCSHQRMLQSRPGWPTSTPGSYVTWQVQWHSPVPQSF